MKGTVLPKAAQVIKLHVWQQISGKIYILLTIWLKFKGCFNKEHQHRTGWTTFGWFWDRNCISTLFVPSVTRQRHNCASFCTPSKQEAFGHSAVILLIKPCNILIFQWFNPSTDYEFWYSVCYREWGTNSCSEPDPLYPSLALRVTQFSVTNWYAT